MNPYLFIDFGSTFTKVTAVDLESKKILGTNKSFTTIDIDVSEGLLIAISNLKKNIGDIKFNKKFASSSAAGGLKMISLGLVKDLTSKAAKFAANNAGAKVLKTYSYEISKFDQKEIYDLSPDIVLLTGGIDGGNKDVILKNAKMLEEIERDFFIVAAGNKNASYEIQEIFKNSNKKLVVTENVMPEFNVLNLEPTKKIIRELFIENIVKAKGLEKVQKALDGEIIPTPLAVFEAAELLSKGTDKEKGLGELMIFDVGGATTDVYSMASGLPDKKDVYLQGMVEPYAKRTVEGDIGVRYSLQSLVSNATVDEIAKLSNMTNEEVIQNVKNYEKHPYLLPQKASKELKLDEAFAKMSIKISAKRHVGVIKTAYNQQGEVKIQNGKDLTNIKTVIATGGSIINSINPREIIEFSKFDNKDFECLLPVEPEFMLDKKNIIAAMGLLKKIEPTVALEIMKNEIIKLREGAAQNV